jgi:predicted DNA-binding transcriptional regulator AlpA
MGNDWRDEARRQGILDPDDLSAYIKIPKRTLYQWRVRGLGPKGIKIGRHLRYRQSDVDAWLDAQAATG